MVRHGSQFPAFPLYSPPVWFGTDLSFRFFHCTHHRFGSARITISGFSTVHTAGLVRHWFQFPVFPLYSPPVWFGTDSHFRLFHCTHTGLVRHWFSFSASPLYNEQETDRIRQSSLGALQLFLFMELFCQDTHSIHRDFLSNRRY